MGGKSGHWIYEAVRIDYFFGLLCGSGEEWSGVELQQWALLGDIMPTHGVPSLSKGSPDGLTQGGRVRLSLCLSLRILSV